jgi:TPR repeat protein
MRSYAVEDTLEPLTTGKLKDCVLDACSRWFIETLRLAKGGDANSAALAAEMLMEGYGCNIDADEAHYWQQVARSGGARKIDGVYDALP